MKNKSPLIWLIWSIEHNAWWKPAACGYTKNRADAGRYTFDEATAIVKDANFACNETPNEAMILDET